MIVSGKLLGNFRKLKVDLFFFFFIFRYENQNPEVKFTEAQLAEIRKTTLAKISCENLEIAGDMQRAAFDLPSNFL